MIEFACAVAHNLACMAAAAGGLGAFGTALAWMSAPRIPCNPYGLDAARCCAECADHG